MINVKIIDELTGEIIRRERVENEEELNKLALSLDVMQAVELE
jgi:hypothetical protein